ncbi:MAG TPA: glycosyltransferase [Verrucomicrobiae bacterium]|nr:glycosyltransferase [Verrucomicrobiae bacterium]
MKNIEIPYEEDRGKRYRFFEMLPGLLTWSILFLPLILSLVNPTLCVMLILGYLLLWFVKSMGLTIRSLQGYRVIEQHMKMPWPQMLQEVEDRKINQPEKHIPSWHYENVRRLQDSPPVVEPSQLYHAIIIAAYNESKDVIEPTLQSVLASAYDMKKVIVVFAYEGRDGARSESAVKELVAEYGDRFMATMAFKHPLTDKEVRGKGGNITYAGRELQKYLEAHKIDPIQVVVTTLDADNRPHKNYLACLSYLYTLVPDPKVVSFQPVPMFTNNIWDAPAPMRVIATGNTFWNVVLSLRPHMIRNFSSHAQSMQTIIDTDFWSVRTIVEDGHQFWRTYFRYEGNHDVLPIYLPIYQDAVLSSTLRKTLKAQFIQIRRWAWGASDVAYVAEMGYFKPNKVPKLDLTFKFLRLLEGHVSWATAPYLLTFAAFIPALFNDMDYASNQLPIVASRIQTIALVGIFSTLFLSLKLLPPKPARYKNHRTVFMVLQWVMLPVTTLVYNATASLYSQTRLMFGRYIGSFDVTDKAVVKENKEKVI